MRDLRFRLLLLATALLVGGFSQAGQAQETLTLRVADAAVEPGDVAVVVIRTYAPRPVSQGQLCMSFSRRARVATRAGETEPLLTVEEVRVFSTAGDATFTVQEMAGDIVLVDFQSLTASVNESDGPLAAIFLRPSAALQPGDIVDVQLDLPETVLEDEEGNPIVLEGRPGELEVLPPGTPLQFEIADAEVIAGQTVRAEIATRRSRLLGSGSLRIRYPHAVLTSDPQIVLQRDHSVGDVPVTSEIPEPGLLTVAFQSVASDFNEIPGDLFELVLSTDASAPWGLYPLSLETPGTELRAPSDDVIASELVDGSLAILPAGMIFTDGFESGDVSAWQ